MTRTTLRPLVAMTHPLALGHQLTDSSPSVIRPAFDNVAMWPAGSVYSSAEDLSRLVVAFFAGGVIEGRQALPSSLFATLSTPHIAMPGDPDVHYGYGLLNFEQRGVRFVMHGGFSRGYGSMIQMVPDHRFAVIVLTNRSGETLPRTTKKAQELFLPLGPEQSPKREPWPLGPADVRRFAGVYVNGEQSWEIREKDGTLVLASAGAEVALIKTGPWRLSLADAPDNDVTFVEGAKGRAEYIFTGLDAGRRKAKP